MQYLVSVIDDTAGLATEDEMAAIDAFNDRLIAEGHWVFAGGLGAPISATVIDNRGGEAIFTDGPFLESKRVHRRLKLDLRGRRPRRGASSSPPRDRSTATGRSRCGRSCERGRRRGGDHPGTPRGVGPGGRVPDQAFR